MPVGKHIDSLRGDSDKRAVNMHTSYNSGISPEDMCKHSYRRRSLQVDHVQLQRVKGDVLPLRLLSHVVDQQVSGLEVAKDESHAFPCCGNLPV
jgi:hypothetical protein